MGMRLFGSSSSYSNEPCQKVKKSKFGNPDPKNFKLLQFVNIGKYTVARILYPDCKNYEGEKILVYTGADFLRILGQSEVDPHFSDNPDFVSPIARFEPTDRGWNLAIEFLRKI